MRKQVHGLNIFLVDDSDDDALLVGAVLRKLGLPHTLTAFSGAQAALDELRARAASPGSARPLPDLLLLDINMPGMDGFAALKELKSEPKLRHIPVVILTTSAAPDDIRRSFDSGAASFISKPTSFEDYASVMSGFSKYWLSVSQLPE